MTAEPPNFTLIVNPPDDETPCLAIPAWKAYRLPELPSELAAMTGAVVYRLVSLVVFTGPFCEYSRPCACSTESRLSRTCVFSRD
jgi:hypothetical protein